MIQALLWVALLAPARQHTVELNWRWERGDKDAAQGFHIQRTSVLHRFVVVSTLPVTARNWTDTAVENGIAYVYAISAFNEAGDSFSNRIVLVIPER